MLRSQYAPEDAETWVELTFEDKGQDYTIRRSPAYTRLSKRKNKDGAYTATSVAPKASLLLRIHPSAPCILQRKKRDIFAHFPYRDLR